MCAIKARIFFIPSPLNPFTNETEFINVRHEADSNLFVIESSNFHLTWIANCKTRQKKVLKLDPFDGWAREKNFTVNFLEAPGSKVGRRCNRQLGAERESKHVSVSEVESFAVKLLHEPQQKGRNIFELRHEQEVVRVHWIIWIIH